ncbi:MAG: DUF971 domain-containing protein [Acidobacteria bacterium]|nr:MAG: DUF971 domain-containing protein [Acidobacteriota bacterium]
MTIPSDHNIATPVSIKKRGDTALEITWGDGHVSTYPARYLRQHCPCASCIDEWTGEKRLAPDSVPVDLKMLSVELVGQYALNFTWSDGHGTGIYSFQTLRRLCPCDQCRGASMTERSDEPA